MALEPLTATETGGAISHGLNRDVDQAGGTAADRPEGGFRHTLMFPLSDQTWSPRPALGDETTHPMLDHCRSGHENKAASASDSKILFLRIVAKGAFLSDVEWPRFRVKTSGKLRSMIKDLVSGF